MRSINAECEKQKKKNHLPRRLVVGRKFITKAFIFFKISHNFLKTIIFWGAVELRDKRNFVKEKDFSHFLIDYLKNVI